MNLTATIGLAIMIVSEGATLARIEPFWSWNTPIAWTGFILFADGIVCAGARPFVAAHEPARVPSAGGCVDSALARVRRFQPVHPQLALRWPAREFSAADVRLRMVVRDDLAGDVRRGGTRSGASGGLAMAGRRPALLSLSRPSRPPALPALPALLSVVAGAVMLAAPFVVPDAVAVYLAAPVWLGFIFLLDPINARLGGEVIVDGYSRRQLRPSHQSLA